MADPSGIRLEGGLRARAGDVFVQRPSVSVITVVFRAASQIATTITSVLALKDVDVEYIVIDGGSNDGTLEVIKAFDDRIDYWLSEPDGGIYDAMNKGIAHARGTFVVHINAGDRLLRIPRDTLDDSGPDVAAVSFPVLCSNGTCFTPTNDWRLRIGNSLHHQGTFYRRTSDLAYDTRYRTFADFDLNQKLAQRRRLICSSGIVAEHSVDGVSHDRSRFAEVYTIIRRNQGIAWVPVCWLSFKFKGLWWRLKCLFGSSR
jgi:glycosyltransferase involved in cell wall biosynthesis